MCSLKLKFSSKITPKIRRLNRGLGKTFCICFRLSLHPNRPCKYHTRKRGWGQEVHIFHVNICDFVLLFCNNRIVPK